jgi:hypothetical protein
VDKAMLALLTDAERLLVAETEKAQLATMDEDELVALHDRIRRARTKYTTNYRRQAASSVSKVGGRGKAHGQNQRSRDKAEVFELALANVSTALAAAARRSAADLKAERLAAAQASSGKPAPARATSTTAERAAAPADRGPKAPTRTTSGSKRPAPSKAKKNAHTMAAGARRQAKRDGR